MKYLTSLLILLTPLTASAQILINEVAWMGTTISANDEWIELYNSSEEEVDLTGWKLKAVDGSPDISLVGTVGSKQYFLLERTDDEAVPNLAANLIYTGALSNTTEHLQLLNTANTLIDEIDATNGWSGGDNSTKQTLERTSDNLWLTSLEPLGTPGIVNSSGQPTEETEPEAVESEPNEVGEAVLAAQESTKVNKGDVIIAEIFPNPPGADTNDEFIELKNLSQSSIDLTGWIIKNSAKQEFVFPSLIIGRGNTIVLYRHQTNLAFNNEKDKVVIYSNINKIIHQTEYKVTAPEGQSYQIDSENKWRWEIPSAGQDNNLKIIVNPVAAIQGLTKAEVNQIITFDGSDSFDPLGRELKFFWSFGDGRISQKITNRQIYIAPGKYEVSLKVVVDATASSTDTFKIEIIDSNKLTKATSTPASSAEIVPFDQIPFIFISEFLPNPVGADADGEFIELFNAENKIVDLTGWQLSDSASKFTFKETTIKPSQYLVIAREQSKISLNNDEDEIRLLMPDGRIVDLVTYQETKEGNSFVLDEKFIWHQSQTPSPGEINILDEIEEIPSPTTTPKILGVATEEIVPVNQPANKTKYWAAGMSGIFALGLGLALKKRPK